MNEALGELRATLRGGVAWEWVVQGGDGACSAGCGGVRGVVRGRAGGAPTRVDRSSRVGTARFPLQYLTLGG